MKYVHLALLLAMTAVVFLFKFQNLDTVTVQSLSASLTLPPAVAAAGGVRAGHADGSTLLSMVRSACGATSKLP